ncbi:MAG: bacteriohopanetetrol glucosamine biosynthesis glycosyltransferase HpnI [Blastocatellia bacterium]|nr:bacteriohopanetetrol glucosamine biosynthesis glycosyltransferase HpnI [Blastocatellia bacterium]
MTFLPIVLEIILGGIALGGLVYYWLAIIASKRLKKKHLALPSHPAAEPPVSLLKPLKGVETGLEAYLTSFFVQRYSTYEILFAVHDPQDPAVAVVQKLMRQYPQIPTKLIVTNEPPYANAKVYSLEQMAAAAAHDVLVITDSDTSVSADYLSAIAEVFAVETVGAATNLYRGVGADDMWSRLEALGMSTEFMAGVAVAHMLGDMDFTLGPSMAVRKTCLEQIGGFAAMADYLADDFVLGHWAAEKGFQVALSPHVINHHATSLGFSHSFLHRLRWNRSTRFSRPLGYLGQGFTYGFAWAALWLACFPSPLSGGFLGISLLTRIVLALVLGVSLLADRTVWRNLWLLPLQDLLSFASWVGGFLGKEVIWRNRRYRILPGGRFVPVSQ